MKISAKDSSYNEDPYLRESHNCYSYFLNLKSKQAYDLCKKTYKNNKICRRSQPGYASHYPSLEKPDFNCPNIMKRTLSDNPNIFQVTKDFNCGEDYYKGALVVAPERDYHYYRLNEEKIWSHKPGYKPSTYIDAKQKIITDPEKADRDYGDTLNYKDFCGYMCVPKDPKKKYMKMYNDSNNNTYNNTNYNQPLKRLDKTLTNKVRKIIKNRNNKTKYKNKNKNKRFNI